MQRSQLCHLSLEWWTAYPLLASWLLPGFPVGFWPFYNEVELGLLPPEGKWGSRDAVLAVGPRAWGLLEGFRLPGPATTGDGSFVIKGGRPFLPRGTFVPSQGVAVSPAGASGLPLRRCP